MKVSKLIKKVNKENAPPDGWKASDAISKAVNWDKLKDPKMLKILEKIFDEKAGYLKSVEKFLISYKLQAASRKRQATSVKLDKLKTIG